MIWELTKKQTSFTVKHNGLVFSRDPLNLTKKNSKNSSGLVNDKAIGITQQNGQVVVATKVAKNSNKPAKSVHVQKFNQYKAPRKLALAVSNTTKGYRDDLRVVAVTAASQYARSNKAKKTYPTKSRK